MSDRSKPSFVFFDTRTLWRSELSVECPGVKNYKRRLRPVWHRMLYSCAHKSVRWLFDNGRGGLFSDRAQPCHADGVRRRLGHGRLTSHGGATAAAARRRRPTGHLGGHWRLLSLRRRRGLGDEARRATGSRLRGARHGRWWHGGLECVVHEPVLGCRSTHGHRQRQSQWQGRNRRQARCRRHLRYSCINIYTFTNITYVIIREV